jgi:hypothetical protein
MAHSRFISRCREQATGDAIDGRPRPQQSGSPGHHFVSQSRKAIIAAIGAEDLDGHVSADEVCGLTQAGDPFKQSIAGRRC